MTVTGQNVDAAAQPFITVTVVVTRFNSTDVDDVDVHTHRPTAGQTEVTRTSEVHRRNLLKRRAQQDSVIGSYPSNGIWDM